jgi:prolyl-tRNA synthetase
MSSLFGRTLREAPEQSEFASHALLQRAGFVRQHAAGIYSYLPLGLRSLRKLESNIREEMDRTGAQEMLMPFVHSADVWRQTGRYDSIDQTLTRFEDRRGHAMVLGMTHEEIVAQLAAREIRSARDADIVVYQIQTKFRDELRPRGGLLRTREFLMKDAYSLSVDSAGLEQAYAVQTEAYHRIFRLSGLRGVRMVRSATGAMGGKSAHEFMCLLDIGEDTLAFCDACGLAANTEVLQAGSTRCEHCGGVLTLRRGVEVGNIFQLGTRYTEALGVRVADREGTMRPIVMGSYGIGVSRLLACLVEQHHDPRGMALPARVAPFAVHLVALGGDDAALRGTAETIYGDCLAAGVEVLYDDRGLRAGEQLADADLIGVPLRLVVGKRTVRDGQVEVVERRTGRTHVASRDDAVTAVQHLLAELLRGEE